MKPTKKSRRRIDTMIDAHAWMRRTARINGEWPAPEGQSAFDQTVLRDPYRRRQEGDISEV